MYNIDEIRYFCEKYGRKKLVLDTNLFILLLVGGYDKDFLDQCRSTKKYSKDDYTLLLNVLQYFNPEIIITPHILTEISNFSKRDIKEPKINYFFNSIVDKLKNCKEENISLNKLLEIETNILVRFGFPDMSIIEVAKQLEAVIITDDIPLSLHANNSNIANINFSHIRSNSLITNTN